MILYFTIVIPCLYFLFTSFLHHELRDLYKKLSDIEELLENDNHN